jgi:Acetyltransferase (GNAT) domain
MENFYLTGSRFVAAPAELDVIAALSAFAPTNPFATDCYFESKRRTGYAAWVLGLTDENAAFECACGVFLIAGKLNRTLMVPSLPAVSATSPFWSGLREFSRKHRVTNLELGTFCSPAGTEIPILGRTCVRRNRCEFVIDLGSDFDRKLSSNHKRNIRKAQKDGLEIRRTKSVDGASAHLALMSESLTRRRARGEAIPQPKPSAAHLAFLQSGAGELFQVLRGETVVSSVLTLRAPKGAYYQSAGTSAEGMSLGASHFLIYSIANQLRCDGALAFNLGGANEESGLARFKEGFGALPIRLPAANCYVGSFWRREASRLIAWLRSLSRNASEKTAISQMAGPWAVSSWIANSAI